MIIGISGKAQSGKNTVSKILQLIDNCKTWGYNMSDEEIIKYCCNHLNSEVKSAFIEVSFAKILKEMASILTGVPVNYWEKPEFKESYNVTFGKTNRKLLQDIGQGLRDYVGYNVWVNALFRSYSNECKWIISDVRFVNEATAIKEASGILIRINKVPKYEDNDVSETNLDNYNNFDYIINNDGSIEDLITQVISIYNKIVT